MSTDTIEREKVLPKTAEPGDHEKFSHYVRREDILRSQVDGVPAVALCGKEWNPTSDPEKYPVCPECKAAWEALRDE